MKKIALITWKFHNYGTVLQAFATNYYLNQISNIQCDLIDYDLKKTNLDIPRTISPMKMVHKLKKRLELEIEKEKLKHITLQWAQAIEEREQKFEMFIKMIPKTEKMNKEKLYSLNELYDIFICGSDQIWNPKFFDGRYMLDFVQDNKVKIAFSPSFGTINIPIKIEKLYKEKLLRLDAISVREDIGCELVQKLVHKKVYHLCDPTLLLTSEEWIRAFQLKIQSEEYILCYVLSNNKWYRDMIINVQNYLKLPIKIIGVKEISYTIDRTEVIHPGPIGFVQYIANARFVITDSFHGMLFATNFNRPYIVLQRFLEKSVGSENSRLKSFMKAANLEGRYYTHIENIHSECFESLNNKQIQYIKMLREESIKYLLRNIDTN